jgi:predicted tellurium resistance membrane protein TerC
MSRKFKDLDSVSKAVVWGLLGACMVAFGMAFYAMIHQAWFYSVVYLFSIPLNVFVVSMHIYAMLEPRK